MVIILMGRTTRNQHRLPATYKLLLPAMLLAVSGGVWYAASHRSEDIVVNPVSPIPVQASAQAAPPSAAESEQLSTPTVEKLPGKVKFTVDAKNAEKSSKIQKVEFYVSSRLIGAAYSQPYTVSVDANALQPGSHKVVAKVYTEKFTKDTPATDFTTTQVATTAPPNTNAIPPSTTAPTELEPDPEPSIPATTSPATDITVMVTDGPATVISWSAPSDGTAVAYNLWRNGALLATTTDTFYNDITVTAGSVYTYYVVAVGAAGAASSASSIIEISVPGVENSNPEASMPAAPPDNGPST